MAKKSKGSSKKAPAPSSALYDGSKSPKLLTVEAGKVLERVHPNRYGATTFNPSVVAPGKVGARFSPLVGADGKVVPTVYAGSTFSVALHETAFHDVPVNGWPKTVFLADLEGLQRSQIEVTEALTVADLSTKGLAKLGLQKTQVIETNATAYPATQAFAAALHAANPDIQGLSWVSRKDDTGRAYVFFEDRMPTGALKHLPPSVPLLDESLRTQLEDSANDIGAVLVD